MRHTVAISFPVIVALTLAACFNDRRTTVDHVGDAEQDPATVDVDAAEPRPDTSVDPMDDPASDVADTPDEDARDASDESGASDADVPDTPDEVADVGPDLDTTPDGRPLSPRAWCNDLPEEPDTCNCAHPDDRCVRGGRACARPDTSSCTEDSCPIGYTCSREGCVCDQPWTCFGTCETNLDCPELSECGRQTLTCEPTEPCRGPCWPYFECFHLERPTFECLVGAECGPDGECLALHEVFVTSTVCGAATEPGCGAMEYRGMDDRCYILRGCTFDDDCPAGYVCNGGPLFNVCSRGLEGAP